MEVHSVEVLEEALQLARSAGFEIRSEFLGESAGGACRLGEKWMLFVDLSLPAQEQLTQVVEALRKSGVIQPAADTSYRLRRLLNASTTS